MCAVGEKRAARISQQGRNGCCSWWRQHVTLRARLHYTVHTHSIRYTLYTLALQLSYPPHSPQSFNHSSTFSTSHSPPSFKLLLALQSTKSRFRTAVVAAAGAAWHTCHPMRPIAPTAPPASSVGLRIGQSLDGEPPSYPGSGKLRRREDARHSCS